jgi:hypothetical protein
MPLFFEIDFVPSEYSKEGYLRRKDKHTSGVSPTVLSFAVIDKVEPEVSNDETQQVVKAILTTEGVPIMVGLSFSNEISLQDREKITAKALEKLQTLSQSMHQQLLSQVYTRYDFDDYQAWATKYIKQHYQQMSDALQQEIPQAKVALTAAMYLPTTKKTGRNFDAMISFGPSSITTIGAGLSATIEVILSSEDAIKSTGLNVIVDDKKEIKLVTQQHEFFMRTTYQPAEELLESLYRQKFQNLISMVRELTCDNNFFKVFKNAKHIRHGSEVMQALQAEITTIHKKSSIKHTAYSIEILTATERLLTAPQDENTRKRFEQLAKQAEGNPDCGKLIGGLMLALLGLVIAGLSIAAGIITGGTMLPLSALGVKTSLPVIGTGISLLATGAAGSMAMALGSGLMFWGRHKGLSAAMVEVDKIMGKSEKLILTAS